MTDDEKISKILHTGSEMSVSFGYIDHDLLRTLFGVEVKSPVSDVEMLQTKKVPDIPPTPIARFGPFKQRRMQRRSRKILQQWEKDGSPMREVKVLTRIPSAYVTIERDDLS